MFGEEGQTGLAYRLRLPVWAKEVCDVHMAGVILSQLGRNVPTPQRTCRGPSHARELELRQSMTLLYILLFRSRKQGNTSLLLLLLLISAPRKTEDCVAHRHRRLTSEESRRDVAHALSDVQASPAYHRIVSPGEGKSDRIFTEPISLFLRLCSSSSFFFFSSSSFSSFSSFFHTNCLPWLPSSATLPGSRLPPFANPAVPPSASPAELLRPAPVSTPLPAQQPSTPPAVIPMPCKVVLIK